MEELKEEFLKQLECYEIGDLTDEQFFLWFKEKIELYGGKLPWEEPAIAIPPQAD